MNNKTRQIIVVVSVFVIALASLGTIIGLLVNTGNMSEYSNGFRYQASGSRITITGYEGDDEDVVVPDKIKGKRVVGIDKDAFEEKSSVVKSIKFNCTSSAFTIAEEAFAELAALERVVLPKNIKEVANGAFKGCKALKTVIVPNSVTKIGANAFKDCAQLKFMYHTDDYSTDGDNAIEEDGIFLPTSLLEIGERAFEACTAIVDMSMKKDLEKIGDYAFYSCTRLSELTVEENSEVTSIGEWAFYNTLLNSPKPTDSRKNPMLFPNLVTIGASAFKNVKNNFVYFSIPKSVKTIGDAAFAESSNLTTVDMAEDIQLESMGEGVFENCSQLTDITLPTGLKEIPAKTFKGCYRLLYNSDFVIGKSVEKIGDGAFAIYTGRGSSTSVTSYSRHIITVDPENEYFTTVRLEDNKREGNETSTYQQGLLTDADGTTVYAYYGSYDANSTNSLGKTFRLLDTEGNFLTDVTTIKPYAFAGVDFEYIQLNNSIKNIGEYVFFGSKVVICYMSAERFEFDGKSFDRVVEPKDNDDIEALSDRIEVGLLATSSAVDEMMEKFREFDIVAAQYNASKLP